MARYSSFEIRRREISKEKLFASMDSDGEIDGIGIFRRRMDDYVGSDQFREVVHDETGKQFLKNELRLF